MKTEIKIAKELLKVAKSLVASERIGDAFYRIDEKDDSTFVDVIFSINTKDRDKTLGWFDSMLQKPGELQRSSRKYGYNDNPNVIPDVSSINGMTFALCFEGNDESDTEGFVKELKRLFGCKELK